MLLFSLILLFLLGSIVSVIATYDLLKKEGKLIRNIVILSLGIIMLVVAILGFIFSRNTKWKEKEYAYIEAISDEAYLIEDDERLIYLIKDPDLPDGKIQDITKNEKIEVEVVSLEEQNDWPYVQIYTRCKQYKEITKYIFYIPKG